jgi:hypothetical protein
MSAPSTPRVTAVGTRFSRRMIAVSVSAAPDLAQLGFPDDQLDRVLEAVLIPLVAEGGRIAYGGQIKHPNTNFTLLISAQLGEAYRRLEQKPGERPFVHFLAQDQFGKTKVSDLVAHLHELAPYGEVLVTGTSGILGRLACIDAASDQISVSLVANKATEYPKGAKGLGASKLYRQIISLQQPAADESLTDLRGQMAVLCDARVQVGGRKAGFSGKIAGLCQEAALTIEKGKPLLCLAGFGGATRDIAAALGLIDSSDCVPREAGPKNDPYERGLELVRTARPRFESVFSRTELKALQKLAGTESVPEASEIVAQFLLGRFAKR